MHTDIHSTCSQLACGRLSLPELWDKALVRARSSENAHTFTTLLASGLAYEGPPPGVLSGLPVSVKDLFDTAGQVTTAGSAWRQDADAAKSHSIAVHRLLASGARIIGRTNMSEFAFSGVGTNPHYGTPAAWDGRYGRPVLIQGSASIPGGSSSGAAVSVATGAALVGLGSDTGGSLRIPAALNGIVGFKPTARLVPTQGALPLSTTLDTVGALTRSVRDAGLVHGILSATPHAPTAHTLSSRRLAVASTLMLDDLDPAVARAFDRAVRALRDAGATVDTLPLPQLSELAAMQSTGSLPAAESYSHHRHWLARHADAYDPRVRIRIERGAQMSASDFIELLKARLQWIQRMESALQGYDAVLSPTVPVVGRPIQSVAPGTQRDADFFELNRLLLRNTSVVNMLDGCAISIPCHKEDEPPVGLMIWHGAMRDDAILQIALQAEQLQLF